MVVATTQDIEIEVKDWTIFPPGTAYACHVIVCKEDEGFSAFAADLPGTVGQGETVKEALDNIREALELSLEVYIERGRIPWQPADIEGDIECEKRIVVNV